MIKRQKSEEQLQYTSTYPQRVQAQPHGEPDHFGLWGADEGRDPDDLIVSV